MLNPGEDAPDFSLDDAEGKPVSLKEFKGKFVVLYFYPKDDTSGCTSEALAFSTLKPQFDAKDAVILGVSPDSAASHAKFRDKHGLKVRLLSDEDKTVINAYGVWVEKKMYGRAYMGVERATFLVGPDGKIVRIWRKVKVSGHAEAVLAALTEAA